MFRIDRLASLYVVRPFRRQVSMPDPSIPILMYHRIADEDESELHPYYRIATAPAVFAVQMEYLHQQGYRTISLAEAVAYLGSQVPSTSKYVVLTFDDGYSDFCRQALPVLSRYGFTATVFLPTAYIRDDRMQFKGNNCLTWAEVRELAKRGIMFGSHTVTHPQLHDLDPRTINEEIVASKHTIEDKLGCAIESFSYPFAFPETDARFKTKLRETLSRAGYGNGVCTTLGTPDGSSDDFFLERLPVNSSDDTSLFQAKLAGAYDWVGKPQYLVKWYKSRLRAVRCGWA